MPSKSKQQQKFMGLVHAFKKGEVPASKVTSAVKKAAKSMSDKSVRKYAKTKHDDLPKKVKEERDYKDEYKKFQSSKKAKKYRAELNKYNRQKGTYGNGDGKDASHKGGKIVGFESQSKNRGRAEKSRLKKEGKLNENPAAIAAAQRMVVQSRSGKVSVNTARQSSYAKKDPSTHKKAKSLWQRIKDRFSKKEGVSEVSDKQKRKVYKKAFGKEYDDPKRKQAPLPLDLAYQVALNKLKRKENVNEVTYKFKGYTNTQMDELDAMLSRAGVKGTPNFNSMTYSVDKKSPKLNKIMKMKGGKLVKESAELEQLVKKFIPSIDKMLKDKIKQIGKKDKQEALKLMKIYKDHWLEFSIKAKQYMNEGTCGYGVDGKLGEEPAGPNLLRKKKKYDVLESKDPDVIKQMRDVLKNGYSSVKDPVSGKKMKVDTYTASAITKVYDSINMSNKKKFAKLPLLKMQSIALKFVK